MNGLRRTLGSTGFLYFVMLLALAIIAILIALMAIRSGVGA